MLAECVPPALDSGKMLPRCVFGRRSVATFSLHAFPKGPRTGKAPVRGNISPPCIQNELASARYARRASESPANGRSGIHRAKILPGRGPFRCARPSDHARRADLATPRRRRTVPGRQADAICRSPSGTRGGVFQLMLQEQLLFPAARANVEARRALAVAHRTKTACHQHFVNAKSTAIFEHNNTRLKAAIPPEPCQHVHRFAVHAPHFAIFRPAVHVCILEQVFV